MAAGLLAIALGVIQGMYPVIPPIVGWPIIAILVLATFTLVDMGIRKKAKDNDEQRREQTEQKLAIEIQQGSLDTVSSQDRKFITAISWGMVMKHGHFDVNGLLADRASGIPLNELMSRNCSLCHCPRDKKGGNEYDD